MRGKKCESCTWRNYMPAAAGARAVCAYMQLTGHSRLKAVYEELGVDYMTDEVRRAMRPENCRVYQKGKIQRIPEVDLLLAGSTPRRKEESGPSQSLRASSPRRGESQEETVERTSTARPYEGREGGKSGGGKRGGRKPKINEARALQLYRQGLNDGEIAKELGMSDSAVGSWRRRMALPVNKHVYAPRGDQMLHLYRQGMTDAQIAEEMGVRAKSVAKWRSKGELPANQGDQAKARAAREEKMLTLYRQGLKDSEIAEALSMTAQAVAGWRWRKRLHSHHQRKDWDKAKARELLERGHTDQEIAEALGVGFYCVRDWRQKQGLACNPVKRHKRKITWEEEGLRLYEQGMSDLEIGQAVGRTYSAIARWRKLRGLPAQWKRKRAENGRKDL